MEYKKKCLWCGKYYVAHTVESRYCSKRCVNLAWKARTRKKEINQKLELRQEVDYHNATADLKSAEFLTPTETARLLRISRSTLYRYLSSEEIKCRQFKGKTLIRRKDIDKLFDEAFEYKHNKAKKRWQPVSKYYTMGEIVEKYKISRKTVWRRCDRFNIPKIYEGRNTFFPRTDIEKHFDELIEEFDPEEYYTPDQVMAKYHMTHAAVLVFARRHKVPRINRQRTVYYSKEYIDSIKSKVQSIDSLYYTSREIMEKYGITMTQVKYYLHRYKIDSIKKGRFSLINRANFDEVFNERMGIQKSIAKYQEKDKQAKKDNGFEEIVKGIAVDQAPEPMPYNEDDITPNMNFGKIEGYLNAKQISEKYKLTVEWVHYLTRKKQIPRVYKCGLLFYDEKAVADVFSKYNSPEGITEWYTSDEVEQIFNITSDQRNRFSHRHKIPTKKEYGVIYYSKLHMDFAKNPGSKYAGEYYKVEEIMEKYHVTREKVYSIVRYRKIPKVRDGKIALFLKSIVDKEFSSLQDENEQKS